MDLIILVEAPKRYLSDTCWAAEFGSIRRERIEAWGAVTSLRVHYDEGPEVEFGFSSPQWAGLPLDPGTRDVLAAGVRVLMDRDGLLERAISDGSPLSEDEAGLLDRNNVDGSLLHELKDSSPDG